MTRALAPFALAVLACACGVPDLPNDGTVTGPGAGGTVGATNVSKRAPDGYSWFFGAVHHTMLLWPIPAFVIACGLARLPRTALMCIASAICCCNLFVWTQYHRQLRSEGAMSSGWTDAVAAGTPNQADDTRRSLVGIGHGRPLFRLPAANGRGEHDPFH